MPRREVIMSLARKLPLLLGFVLTMGGLAAQEGEQEEPSPPPAEESEPRPAPDADDVFIPTEEIPVDEEVTFPVNI